jgi:hypothetical protein
MAGQGTGMHGQAYWQYLRGAVDDLRIYDVALDAAGVAAVAADVLAPDLWSGAGLARSAAADLDGSSFQDVFTEAELAALGGAVGDRFAMSFDATSSCAEPLELGFSGGGGWLKATVAPGSGTYAVAGPRLALAPTRYEVRTSNCGGAALALARVAYAADPLVAAYDFAGGAAAEARGLPLDGAVVGGAPAAGADGGTGAVALGGGGAYVELPAGAGVAGAAPRTYCVWAAFEPTHLSMLFSHGDEPDGVFVSYRDGGMNVDFWDSGTDVDLAGADARRWHHYCLAYGGGAWTFYLDGALRASGAAALATAGALRLGHADPAHSWQADLDGRVDDFRVYAAALDAAAVAALYASHARLVARYAFDDGTAAEDGDGSLDGIIAGAAATIGRDGGGALAFDGTDDYVEFPAAVTSDILGNSARTVCLWARVDAFDGGTLFSYDSNGSGERFGFMTESAAGEFGVLGYGSDYDFRDVAVSGSDDGDWHHYCHTYDGTDWKFYFNGALAHTETVALDTGSDNPLTLGVRYSGGYSGYFSGKIDDVYVYSSALTAAAIEVLYNEVAR